MDDGARGGPWENRRELDVAEKEESVDGEEKEFWREQMMMGNASIMWIRKRSRK